MTVEYLDLADYLAIAAEVTSLDTATVTKVTRLSLADSALHAPAARFGDVDLYPDFVAKAAVLLVRLVKNHPLPDGKQAGGVGGDALVRRDQRLDVGPPTRYRRRRAMVFGIAAGNVDEAAAAEWLSPFLAPAEDA